jgi:hypothetical protein
VVQEDPLGGRRWSWVVLMFLRLVRDGLRWCRKIGGVVVVALMFLRLVGPGSF